MNGGGKVISLMIGSALLSGCAFKQALRATEPGPAMQPMLQPPKPVSVPLEVIQEQPRGNNSLWRAGAKAFLRDQRGCRVGDAVLVQVNLQNDQATLKYKTVLQSPTTSVDQQVKALGGFENQLTKVLPKAAKPENLISMTKSQDHEADTSITRKETIKLTVSATLIKQLPQGNFLIYGHQQLLVNHDRRDVYIAGIVDPKSIAQDNTVLYQDIAEVRLVYGGVGTLHDAQARRALDRWLNAFLPF